ncbi:hypothetical protein EDB83DRAFT_2390063 [Lactarius deliciosus]|nr:hypothetical protein EDB83DRAFT_2390063 [Lactarius deliciosus]
MRARRPDPSPSPLARPPVRAERGQARAHPTSPCRPCPTGARRTACPPQSPSAQATPAQPHAPRPARIRERKDGAPIPPRAPRRPNPTCPALPAYARGRTACLVPLRPRTQGEGRRAQPSPPRRGRHQPSPTRPTPPCPHSQEEGWCAHLRAGHASPAARTRKGEGQRVHPLRTGYASPAFTHPATPAYPRGCKRVGAPSPPTPRGTPALPGFTPRPRRGACKGEGRTHAREGYTERGTMQPERERRAKESREGCASEAGRSGAQPGWGSRARTEGCAHRSGGAKGRG